MASDWQNRAIPADEPKATSGSSWMDRAVPAEHIDSASPISSGPQDVTPSMTEALARGAGQGVTAGFGEEGSGGLSAAFDKASGNDASLLDLYHKYRDADRAKNEAAHKAHPWAYTAGNIVGSIPMMAATAGLGGALGIGGEAGTLGRAVAQGAADAGLMGAGNSNADLTSGKLSDAKQFGKDVGGSALLGGGTGVLAHGLSGAANEIVAPYLKKKAEDLAARHLRPTPKLAQALGKEGVRDAAREALDSGAIQPWQTADQTSANLENLVNETGAVKGDIVNASEGQIDPIASMEKFDREVIDPLRAAPVENKTLIAQMEAKKQAFLDQYAPGYTPGGRAPGTPTTITRKSQFVPQAPATDFAGGMKQVGEHVTPNVETEVVQNQVPGPHGVPVQQQQLRAFNTGETRTPINGYSTPEPTAPYQTDPASGLPVKQIAEKRIEGVPEVTPMSPAQMEAEKSAAQNKIDYASPDKVATNANKGYARVLKEGSEEAISDPNFVRSKEAYGNLKNAQIMADRTGSLTDGGGLMGHFTDVGIGTEALHELAKGNPAGLVMVGARAASKGKLASTAAVGLDKLSRIIQTNPQAMGKYAPILKNAAARGSSALAATHFILSQTEEGYRSQANQAAGGDQ